MNLTFEMVAMEDLLDAAVQCEILLKERVFVRVHASKRLEAHLGWFINERQNSENSLHVYISLCTETERGCQKAIENEERLYICAWEDIARKCHTCHVS